MYSSLKLLIILSLVFLTACSKPEPLNKWQHDAASMCQNYQKHFLQDKALRASLDLSHARKAATHSADLSTLIDVELTACAMELIAFNSTTCRKAAELLLLEPDNIQNAYLKLLTSELTQDDLSQLPEQYQAFAQAYIDDDPILINESLLSIEPLSSRLIASTLAKENIDEENLIELIEALSHHGYKKPLILWLDFQMQNEHDPQEKKRLRSKIEVLTSH